MFTDTPVICHYLKTLEDSLSTGYTLLDTIDLLIQSEKRPRLRQRLIAFRMALLDGQPIAACLRYLWPTSQPLLHFGHTERLATLLALIRARLEHHYRIQKQLISKSLYPCFLLTSSLGMLSVLSGPLSPVITHLSSSIRLAIIGVALISMTGLVIGLTLVIRRIKHLYSHSQLFWEIHVSLSHGQPLIHLAEIGCQQFLPTDLRYQFLFQLLQTGSFYHAYTTIFSLSTLQSERLRYGESHGSLTTVLSRLSDDFKHLATRYIDRLIYSIQPLSFLIVGLLILLLIYTLYLPTILELNAILAN